MKKLIALLLIANFTFVMASAHTDTNQISNTTNVSIDNDALLKFMGDNLKYPQKARWNNTQGASIVLFTIKKGVLGGLKIHEELGNGCETEVLNALLAYPNFKTQKDGNYALKTIFRLGEDNPILTPTNIPDGYQLLKLVVVGAPLATASNGQITKEIKPYQIVKSNVVIRGAATGNQPLVYVDGAPVDYDLMGNTDPNTIETITILKGPSAVAKYGIEAQFGAIVITTKVKTAPVKEEPAKGEAIKRSNKN